MRHMHSCSLDRSTGKLLQIKFIVPFVIVSLLRFFVETFCAILWIETPMWLAFKYSNKK